MHQPATSTPRARALLLLLPWLLLLLLSLSSTSAQTGFLSIDCGATQAYVDPSTGLYWVPDAGYVATGTNAEVRVPVLTESTRTLRYFGQGNQSKYCYTIAPVDVAARYLLRATFLHGGYDGAAAYPIFGLSLDATPWATITIVNASMVYFEEMMAIAKKTSFSVCLMKQSVGLPFISSLELRPLTGAIYAAAYEATAHRKLTVRINFGTHTLQPIRYPDDPIDRIWQSDLVPGVVQNPAPGTTAISTTRPVDVRPSSALQDPPPVKVMQTAVVGNQNLLSYGMYLKDFPASAYAVAYFAEITDIPQGKKREFTLNLDSDSSLNGFPVNLEDNPGPYVADEPGYSNVSLRLLVQFELVSTPTSDLGPILNALEVLKIVPIVLPTVDSDEAGLQELRSLLGPGSGDWEGDPCLPMPWNWVGCTAASPPRVALINLSGTNLTGQIPSSISRMTSLMDLWLDNNHLTGPLPDLYALTNLTTLHVQNNNLSGSLSPSIAGLVHLTELFVQQNDFSGQIPPALLKIKKLHFEYSGNPQLCASSCSDSGVLVKAITSGVAGGLALLAVSVAVYVFYIRTRRKKQQPLAEAGPTDEGESGSTFTSDTTAASTVSLPPPGLDDDANQARQFSLSELNQATKGYSMKIGQGGFGPVYHGTLKKNQEIAVKVLAADSRQGTKEFRNEVILLSRVHHRCLVSFLGYCQADNESILVYEFMQNGTLKDHLSGPAAKEEALPWMTRLRIALDAAIGLDYLHAGCNPPIIHRDVKSSNILLDTKFHAKVADFGLSKLMSDHNDINDTVSIKGTVGYLDPEYYVMQQLTEKSDVYSFGVVLLEILSGRESILQGVEPPDNNIASWARTLVQKGDIRGVVDPHLGDSYGLEAAWKFGDAALQAVEPHYRNRPNMGDIVRELKEVIAMEGGNVSEESEEMDGRTQLALSTPHESYHQLDFLSTDTAESTTLSFTASVSQ